MTNFTRRTARLAAAAALACLFSAPGALADVKVEERTHMKMPGVAGTMMKMLSKAARESGATGTTAVRNDRKMDVQGDRGTLVDLAAETISTIEFDKKRYKVQTFEELRRAMEEGLKNAAAQPSPQSPSGQQEADFEIDFDLKETGKTEVIAGKNCREVQFIVTVRPKGKTLEDGGGNVMTASEWLGPKNAALEEIHDFNRRYAQKLYGKELAAMSAELAGAATIMGPAFTKAMKTLSAKKVNMEGTPYRTTMTWEMVAGKDAPPPSEQQAASPGTMMGGLMKAFGKKTQSGEAGGGAPGRVTLFTSSVETLSITPKAEDGDVSIPAGFKKES